MTQATTTRTTAPTPAPPQGREGDSTNAVSRYGIDVVREALSLLPIAIIDDVR